MKEGKFTFGQTQNIEGSGRIDRADINLPNRLASCVATQRCCAVRVALDSANVPKAGLGDANVHAASTGEQADSFEGQGTLLIVPTLRLSHGRVQALR